MNCKNLNRAIVMLWVGDSEKAKEDAKECMNSLKEEINNLRSLIKEAKMEAENEYLLPKTLREKRLNPEDLIKVAMYELSRRIYLFSGNTKSKERSGIIYLWLDLGVKKILRGYCEDCYGYISTLLGSGFVVMVDGVIYAEFLGTDENKAVESVLEAIKGHRKNK
ncbi:hypothetical protein [Stygiolobus azoricus]|uniref:Uncharacterized protein n=1 Tax=Stygiolobus azoricus TaxID=41675 RepID=A0A650CLN0_9CREN|nr:hypothetical protein [Stygiolobus azoricus]QGR18801.1 hypothetical protein D1868_01525 [Stygiolobus azoricus]